MNATTTAAKATRERDVDTSIRIAVRLLLDKSVNVHVSKPSDTRLDFEGRSLRSMIRASVHYYNTRHEIARFCELVDELTTGVSVPGRWNRTLPRLLSRGLSALATARRRAH
jgi:hypothetical protein